MPASDEFVLQKSDDQGCIVGPRQRGETGEKSPMQCDARAPDGDKNPDGIGGERKQQIPLEQRGADSAPPIRQPDAVGAKERRPVDKSHLREGRDA